MLVMRTEAAVKAATLEVTYDPRKSSQWTTFLGCFGYKGEHRDAGIAG